jgi:phosphate transport system permease protein
MSCALVVFIIIYVFVKGIPHFKFANLFLEQSKLFHHNGLAGSIINTLYIILGTLILAGPIGVCGAIYLNEYATNKKVVAVITFTSEVLSGIPSIIFGLFGMIFFGEVMHLQYSVATGCLTLAILVLPIIIRNTQTALEAVPKSYREAAQGMGSTKWYMIRTVILPSAVPGILTGIILAMGRIIAESAALLFTAGSGYVLPRGFFSHFLESGETLTIDLYMRMINAQYGQAFVIAMILVVIILFMNALARFISTKFDVNSKVGQ